MEWLDTSEIEMHCVILNDAADLDRIQEFTHVEVHTAASMLGLTAAMTPFSNQDQSPRCIYQGTQRSLNYVVLNSFHNHNCFTRLF